DARDDVDFEAYIIRITDEDGDVVDEGDDVATVGSSYGTTGVGAAEALNKLFIADLETSPTFTDDDGTVLNTDYALTNVRINDGGTISPALHLVADPGVLDRNDTRTVIPDALSIIRVGSSTTVGAVFADPPDEHRDLPMDTLTSDTTYTITAWAINEDDEVISPVATLEVRPSDAANTATAVTDYLNAAQTVEDLVVTRFTVLK
ncbi:MAG: hypothetical protein J4G06_04480, partial [Caldilineaceae bacterium]|nr:hypothetical protein [Caldilineaceae bacterium]